MENGNMKINQSYQELGPQFFSFAKAKEFNNPELIILNSELLSELGLDELKNDHHFLTQIFSGQKLLEGSTPIAQAYAGHQFGQFSPILGDGRALLLGDINNKDIVLKGAGPTPYSRRGDGLSALGPSIREYILSEYMHRLNIPTTRALAVIKTNEEVARERLLPGGILTRVATSHVRIGTFQYFLGMNNVPSIRKLLNYSIKHYYPEILTSSKNELDYPILFLRQVIRRQVSLIVNWMSIGFIHGVMNTDNMAISGETLDFGPCAFMDYFDYNQVYSFIDKSGRYRYINQPNILAWNLSRLADTLIPIISEDQKLSTADAVELLNRELESIPKNFESELVEKFSSKLGISFLDLNQKKDLVVNFMEEMNKNKIDFTSSFRILSHALRSKDESKLGNLNVFYRQWSPLILQKNETADFMDSINPIYIPRNHLVLKLIDRAYLGDYSMFFEMVKILTEPFKEHQNKELYSNPPKEDEIIVNTFCGT